jgi:WD40 repeat protein
MVIPLESSIVRIYSNKNKEKPVGAGFLVFQKHVLTCAHVVASALGIVKTTAEMPTTEVSLDFPRVAPGQLLTAKVVFWRPVHPNPSTLEEFEEDIAALELGSPPPEAVRPSRLVPSKDLWGHPFRVFGFPEGQTNGVWASGVLRGGIASGWVQLEDVKETGYRLEKGFSGAPVWDEELQGVAGMAVAAEMNRPGVKAAFIIPTSMLVRVWPTLGKRAILSRPFMVEDLPNDFVPRPREFEQLIAHLLDEQRGKPIAITAALRGAGGYGKTMLAKALCHDERIRWAFDDGILWVTLGEKPNVLAGLTKLYAELTGQRLNFVDVEDAAGTLAQAWGERDCLLVIDDVWNEAHLRPFLRGGKRCARLVTTRDSSTLPPKTQKVEVDAMQQGEAVALLGFDLPTSNLEKALRQLGARLGEWPLLLKLVNGALRNDVDNNQTLSDALAYVNKALDKRGLTAFDARSSVERNQAVAKTLDVSLELLSEDERSRYGELAIFPEDVNIPLVTLEKLWGATGGLDDFDTQELCKRLHQLSLLLLFDRKAEYIRLHDVVRKYLERGQSEKLSTIHCQLLDAYAQETWVDLPAEEPYLWDYLAYHLVEAGRKAELRRLLFNFNWLQTKLEATNVSALIVDYAFLAHDADLRLVESAIQLSAHVLVQDKTQLASQLLGRLLSYKVPEIQVMLEQAKQWRAAPWLRPLTPSLMPPGGPLLRTVTGHTGYVHAVAMMPDSQHAISASPDNILKVWNLESGEELYTLQGHTSWVEAVAVTSDGRRAISASSDTTLKVWDLESKTELCTLRGHTWEVSAVAVTSDGRRVISASSDTTLKVWDLESGEELHTLRGHTGWLNGVAVTPDGRRVISASSDTTLKVWDLESGEELHTLRGHSRWVNGVAVTPDGWRAISVSEDGTLKVWNLESGEELYTLQGHTSWVKAVAVMPNGQQAISASGDTTLKVWDLRSGTELYALRGHGHIIYAVAVMPDSQRAIFASEDGTLKVWDLESGKQLHSLHGHSSWVRVISVTPDSQRAISASGDNTLKVWNLESGMEVCTLQCHGWINAVALMPDGLRAISTSDSGDNTLKVWDLESKTVLCTLQGHTDWINGLAVTLDGRRAISSSGDNTLKVWDLGSGKVIASFSGDSALNACAVASDGVTIVVGDALGKIYILRLEEVP